MANMSLEQFSIQMNGVRNATFFMLAAILNDIAESKGEGKDAYLEKIRSQALGLLDSAKMADPAEEKSPATAQTAEISRVTIAAMVEASKIIR